jgi:hypothetical protein
MTIARAAVGGEAPAGADTVRGSIARGDAPLPPPVDAPNVPDRARGAVTGYGERWRFRKGVVRVEAKLRDLRQPRVRGMPRRAGRMHCFPFDSRWEAPLSGSPSVALFYHARCTRRKGLPAFARANSGDMRPIAHPRGAGAAIRGHGGEARTCGAMGTDAGPVERPGNRTAEFQYGLHK